MKILGYIVGGVVGIFLLMLVIGASISPAERERMAKEKQVDEFCDKAMADSALGAERRMTRNICDELKAKVKNDRK